MDIDPAEFSNVPVNSNEATACSPTPPGPLWRGVLVRAPHRVSFGLGGGPDNEPQPQRILPICGYYLADVDVSRRGEKMRIVAVDRKSGRTYSGTIEETDPSPDAPPPIDAPQADPKTLSGLASGGYFNVNLFDFVRLPAETARYDVHVEFRDYRSNRETVTIEFVHGP